MLAGAFVVVSAAPYRRHMLTEQEAAMLDLERSWFKFAGAKDEAISERFGMTPVRYFAVLGALIERADAEAHDAVTVRRLRRLRDRRQRARSV